MPRSSHLYFIVALSILGCERLVHQTADQRAVFTKAIPIMDAVLTMTVWESDSAKAQMAMDAAAEEVSSVESIANAGRADSEVSEINQLAGKGPEEVSDGLFSILLSSLDLAKETNGWTDVTMGALVRTWGFDQPLQGESQKIPPSTAINVAKKSVGYKKLLLDEDHKTISLEPGTMLDFDAVVRGYALDRAMKALKEYDISIAKLNWGDQWVFLGTPPEGAPWKVALRNPRRPSETLATLEVLEGAVSIRTDEDRYFVSEGKRYSRIIDPRTGWPVRKTALAAVWSPVSALQADGWANAMFIAGADEGIKWISAKGELAAAWVSSASETITKESVRSIDQPKAKVVLP